MLAENIRLVFERSRVRRLDIDELASQVILRAKRQRILLRELTEHSIPPRPMAEIG
jgi:hypothetical protein